MANAPNLVELSSVGKDHVPAHEGVVRQMKHTFSSCSSSKTEVATRTLRNATIKTPNDGYNSDCLIQHQVPTHAIFDSGHLSSTCVHRMKTDMGLVHLLARKRSCAL